MSEQRATTRLDAPASRVLDVLTDVPGLPSWNEAITGVVTDPGPLTPGAEWVVELKSLGQSWHSRSRVLELDRSAGVFAYRSCTDDENPSFVIWRWTVTPSGAGADVSVTWQVNPKTFWRRVLFAKIRRQQLARTEVPRSLAALAMASRAPVAHG